MSQVVDQQLQPSLPPSAAPKEHGSVASWVFVIIFWPILLLLYIVLWGMATSMRAIDALAGRSARISEGGVGSSPSPRP